jgi:VanZ family protein
MKKFKKSLAVWLPVFVWCLFIFCLSSFPTPQPTKTLLDFLFHKAFHLFEYAILFVLVYRAGKDPILAILFVILYGLSDEIHQSFVATRGASSSDVLIDFMGGVLGWWFILQTPPKKRKK